MKHTLITCLFLSSMAFSVQAAEFCVGTVAELRAALDTAESNNEDDDIRLELGTYDNNGLQFSYDESLGYDLRISGGWIDFFDNDCGIQSPNEPLQTIIDGGDFTRGLYISASNDALIEVSSLSFQNGNIPNSGGGLYITRADNFNTGEVVVANNAFIGNQAAFGAALSITSANTIHVRNNLVIANNATDRHSVSIIQNDANGVYFNNNTVMANTSNDDIESGAVYLYTDGSSNLLVANNILKDNQNEDLDARNSSTEATYYVFNNNLDVLVGTVPDVFTGNFNLPNRFESGFLSFTPDADSPLVNAGKSPCGMFCPVPTPFVNDWELGDVDLLEHARIQEGKVDIGAFESSHIRDVIFWNRFD